MPSGHREHKLREVPVPDEQVSKPTAIDLSSLASQREQCWIDQQLLVAIAFVCRGVVEARPRAQINLLTDTVCDIADGGCQRENIIMEAHVTSIVCGMGGRLPGSRRRTGPVPLRRESGHLGSARRTVPSRGTPGEASSPVALAGEAHVA